MPCLKCEKVGNAGVCRDTLRLLFMTKPYKVCLIFNFMIPESKKNDFLV
jgi:hypothetical protein